jgi:mycothiol synthase
MRQPQLLMRRRSLERMPKPTLPKGFALRTYQEGDDRHWADIIARAFQTECSVSVFRREIADQEAFQPERVFFLLYEGQPVGTATAWFKPEFGPQSGYVHMVAVVPEHMGKGLGRVLTSAVLKFFKERGLRSAFLHTDDERLAAISTYLELGFEPVIKSEGVRRRWVEVFRELKKPDLSHRYCGEE